MTLTPMLCNTSSAELLGEPLRSPVVTSAERGAHSTSTSACCLFSLSLTLPPVVSPVEPLTLGSLCPAITLLPVFCFQNTPQKNVSSCLTMWTDCSQLLLVCGQGSGAACRLRRSPWPTGTVCTYQGAWGGRRAPFWTIWPFQRPSHNWFG